MNDEEPFVAEDPPPLPKAAVGVKAAPAANPLAPLEEPSETKDDFDAKHNVLDALEGLARLRQMARDHNPMLQGRTLQEIDSLIRWYEPVLSTLQMMAFASGVKHERFCHYAVADHRGPAPPPAPVTGREGYG